ncbi:ABC transporter ATP-binding protein [Pseudofrankia sp. DC12]|uniref:ABC transporter ATP-binding protein n=1 Tax=Pseudofrankia sp. DC12 TaxID=683315 RepID=UPI0005F846AC|nr:ABC transporter ATP-binding protein [Pseudofrankia sp. DC12]
MSTIELRDVSLTYDVGPVLDHVSLSVEDGEFLVLVGPSGSGKTTALRIVAGLLSPRSGQVLVAGEDVTRVPPAERDLAMVFQSYALYPHMTVRNNMAFGLRLAGVSRRERDERVERAAKILGLTELLERRPKALSGGQRQRVAMGRAIVREPRAFLMDEPLSNLDAKLRTQVRAQIGRIQRDLGITTLYVTHDQVEAMTMADRIAVLHEGKLQQLGTPDELFSQPANAFVAAFIGSPPTNLVPGTLTTADGQTALRVGGQTLVLPAGLAAAVSSASTPDVLVGVRPHDVQTEAPETAALTLEVAVDLVERLGTETLVHGEMVTSSMSGAAAQAAHALTAADDGLPTDPERHRFTAALDARTAVSAGSRALFYVTAARLHLFDAETGVTLRAGRKSLATV